MEEAAEGGWDWQGAPRIPAAESEGQEKGSGRGSTETALQKSG